MKYPEKTPFWLVPGIASCILGLGFVMGAVVLTFFMEPATEPLPPPIEEPEPQVWRGRVECVYGNTMMYSVDNLVDFIVTAQPGGWMWEMFREDGTVIFYHQPKRTFCSAVPEEP